MPALNSVNYQQMHRILTACGYELLEGKGKGDHRNYEHSEIPQLGKVTVPYKGNELISKGYVGGAAGEN